MKETFENIINRFTGFQVVLDSTNLFNGTRLNVIRIDKNLSACSFNFLPRSSIFNG